MWNGKGSGEWVRLVGPGSPVPDEEAGSARSCSPGDGPPEPVWGQRERKPERPREEQTDPGRHRLRRSIRGEGWGRKHPEKQG